MRFGDVTCGLFVSDESFCVPTLLQAAVLGRMFPSVGLGAGGAGGGILVPAIENAENIVLEIDAMLADLVGPHIAKRKKDVEEEEEFDDEEEEEDDDLEDEEDDEDDDFDDEEDEFEEEFEDDELDDDDDDIFYDDDDDE